MKLQALREEVCRANKDLQRHGLVILTWGNVSGIDRGEGVVVIKPSGISYDALTPESLAVVALDGTGVEGVLQPSTDVATHLELYKAFPDIGGITHTHSTYATMWAQACRDIPCFGTTHADYFNGPVPVTRSLTPDEVAEAYEKNTGRVIIERLARMNPMEAPAVLVAHHGPFVWGAGPAQSVENSVVLEEIAKMAAGTCMLSGSAADIPDYLLARHYLRKHGAQAYYGQSAGNDKGE